MLPSSRRSHAACACCVHRDVDESIAAAARQTKLTQVDVWQCLQPGGGHASINSGLRGPEAHPRHVCEVVSLARAALRRQLCLQAGSSQPANPDHTVHVAADRPICAAWICHSRRWDSKRRGAAGGCWWRPSGGQDGGSELLNDVRPESS
jgi:hypothetical protein